MIRINKFNEQREQVYKVNNLTNKILDNINFIDQEKRMVTSSIYNGLEINNIDLLVEQINKINDECINKIYDLKKYSNNVLSEIHIKE